MRSSPLPIGLSNLLEPHLTVEDLAIVSRHYEELKKFIRDNTERFRFTSASPRGAEIAIGIIYQMIAPEDSMVNFGSACELAEEMLRLDATVH